MGTPLRRVFTIAALLSALTLGASPAVAGPISPYFIFGDVPDEAWVFQNNAIQLNFRHLENDLAIAVSGGSIRALQWDLIGNGSQYDYAGNVIGNGIYAPIAGFAGQALDGTSDGTNNYVGEWASNGEVFRTDANWAGGVSLFTTNLQIVGITHDGANNSLWISAEGGSIFNYDMAGNVLSSFNPGPGRWGALAWEAASNTLWAINNANSEIRNWSKTGTLLETIGGNQFGNVWGGEFDQQVVPEPASLLLLGAGLAGLRAARRRNR